MAQVNSAHGNGTFLAVVYEAYDDQRFTPLDGAVAQVGELADVLGTFGYRPTVLSNPDQAALLSGLPDWSTGWAADGAHGPAVVAWSGHAERGHRADLWLITRRAGSLRSRDEYVTTDDLVSRVLESGADQVLVLLDTCHAGAGAHAAVEEALSLMANRTLPAPRRAWLGVLAACQEGEQAEGGRGALLEAVLRTLRHGPAPESRYRHEWSVRNKGISGHTLAQTVIDGWPSENGQNPVQACAGHPEPIFRNPLWRAHAGEALVAHLVLAAKGIDPTEEGWFFTGRRRLLGEITEWLAEGRPGMLLLMGSAGCGKSAVAGRIAALSHPEERRQILENASLLPGEPDPGRRSVDAAVHLRGMRVQDVAEALAEKLGLPAPETPAGLIAELECLESAGARRHVLVLDGLDEAAPDQAGPIAEQLLVPLSRLCTVLLASRDRPFQPHAEPGETLGAALTRAAGAAVRVVDLDEEPDTGDDIAAYVAKRLEADGVPTGIAAEIAPELAGRAARGRGGFLFARIVASALARHLSADPAHPWRDRIPDGIEDALSQDLQADGPLPAAANDLLTALAWAAGTGMPAHGVWQAAAGAISRRGATYGPEDIDWVLARYGRYIVEDSDADQAVYRLYHRELVAHLREADARRGRDGEDLPGEVAVLRALVALTLRQTGGGARPKDANAYLRQYLPEHAVVAEETGVSALRELAEVNSAAYLPVLAVVLRAFAWRRDRAGRGEEAMCLADEAVALHRDLAKSDPAAHRPQLAMSLNIFCVLLAQNGQRETATAVAEESVAIFRELTAASPAAHRGDLADSLSSLSNLLAEAERHDEALELAEEAVAHYQELARTGPDVHRPGLAGTLVNLGLRLRSVGKQDEALDAVQKGTDLYRELARENTTAHRRELAAALSNLASEFVDAGRHKEALGLAEEATACHRDLAKSNPAAHHPDLAVSLGNLSVHLAEFERHQEALELGEEAVALQRELARANPAAHRPSLAYALDRLAMRLGDNGRYDEALAVAEEGVRLHHELATTDPDAHLDDLARSLGQFADRLGDVGRHDEAVAAAEQAFQIYSMLARTSPSAHRPNLAWSLRALAVRLAKAGRREEAVVPAARSVSIRRRLAEANPGKHSDGLAASLSALAAVLPPEAALQAAEESAHIRRHLALANPAVHQADLADSLQNLSIRLAETARYDEAMPVAQESIGLFRELVESNPAVHLPRLGVALGNLGNFLSHRGDPEQAVRHLEECAGILRRLTLANRAAHLPDLLTALNNLAVNLTEAGRPEEAVAPADEVARIRRDLALADATTHLPDLLTALNNLALHLQAAGRPEEVTGRFEEIIESCRGQAHVAAALACQLATHHLSIGAPDAVVDLLCPLLSGTAEDLDAEVTFMTRRLLRRATEADPTLREIVARRCGEDGAAPEWLEVSEAALRLTESWLTTPTPAESHAFLLAHPELLEPESVQAVRGWALLNPAALERAERLERIAAGTPVDTVYRPLLLWTIVADWFTGGEDASLSADHWTASAEYLTAHATDLLTAEADQVLAEMAARAPETAFVAGYHRALLGLATQDGIEPTYALVRGPHALQNRIRTALDAADAKALEWLADLEASLFFAVWPAMVHRLTAQILSGAPASLAALSDISVLHPPTPADRNRAAADLAALLATRPDKAPALGALLQAVLTAGPGQSTDPDRTQDAQGQARPGAGEGEETTGA